MAFQRYLLLFCVGIIYVVGLLMVFNTSSAEIIDELAFYKSTHHALVRQLLYGFFGIILAVLFWYIGYDSLLRFSWPALGLVTFLLVLVFVLGIGVSSNGAHRWIGGGGVTFQPSEIAKFVIPGYCLYAIHQSEKDDLKHFLKIIVIAALPMILILLEPDNGTVAIIGVTLLVVCFLTGVKKEFWLIPSGAMVLAAVMAIFTLPYVSGRLKVYLNPEADILGRGHQPYQARIATGSGELFGRGFGQSLQKLNYLPEAQNDYIAAIYAEEFGFIGILALITLYMIIVYLGFHIAIKAKDRGGFYLAAMITFLIAFQAFLNLGVVSGLLPSTGLNLPFFSQGGTSLIVNFVALGVLLNIAYKSEKRGIYSGS
ncbi:MAG: putative lipid II flippase FtsW [Chlamydiota bacterium]